MRVVLNVIGRFHVFDLARYLESEGCLEAIYTGYPMFKLKNERLPLSRIKSFPFLQTLFMSQGRLGIHNENFSRDLAWWAKETLDSYAKATMPKCDVYMALSGVGLRSSSKARKMGAIYICDRGSSHIRYQDEIMRQEHERYNRPYRPIDPRIVEKEIREYAEADVITVPSTFAYNSFLEMGVSESKMRLIPYGVDISSFTPTGTPDPEAFDVLFVGGLSIRKGVRYLLESFDAISHPRKRLNLVGIIDPFAKSLVDAYSGSGEIIVHGQKNKADVRNMMSSSHVLVLPSVEEGLALVQAEALASGCPVVASFNTGSSNLFEDGQQGFIVEPRNSEALAEKLQLIADSPELRDNLSKAALERVKLLGGWNTYGKNVLNLYRELTANRNA